MKAPEIEADRGKKVEVLFPTSEVVSPEINDSAEASVIVAREKTVVDLGTISVDVALTLTVVGNHNPGMDVVVVFDPCGQSRTVTINETIEIVSAASDNVATTLTYVNGVFVAHENGGNGEVPTQDGCCEAIKVDPGDTESVNSERTLVEVAEMNALDADAAITLKFDDNPNPFAEVVVAFNSDSTARDVAVTVKNGDNSKTVTLEGTASETTVKMLVVHDKNVFVL